MSGYVLNRRRFVWTTIGGFFLGSVALTPVGEQGGQRGGQAIHICGDRAGALRGILLVSAGVPRPHTADGESVLGFPARLLARHAEPPKDWPGMDPPGVLDRPSGRAHTPRLDLPGQLSVFCYVCVGLSTHTMCDV